MRLAQADQQAGNLGAARARYEAVLGASPDHPFALHFLGILLADTGEPEPGLAMLRRSVALRPDIPGLWNNFSVVLRKRGAFEEALAAAETSLRLRAASAPAWLNKANALKELGRADAARIAYLEALAIDPNHIDTLSDFGWHLLMTDGPDTAIRYLDRAAELAPEHPGVRISRGNVFKMLKDYPRAEAEFRHALARQPTNAHALTGLASVLLVTGRAEDGLQLLDIAVAIQPDLANAHAERAVALTELNQFDDAHAALEEATRLAPQSAANLDRRAFLLYRERRYPEAIAAYDAAASRSDDPGVRFSRALAHLAVGEMAQGWKDYEARLQLHTGRDVYQAQTAHLATELWTGAQPLEGRTILVVAEQGFGDCLQFCRLAPLLTRRGARVILVVPPALVGLLGTLEGVAAVVKLDEPTPPADYFVWMMSLGLRLGITLESIPKHVPYLSADPVGVARWRERLAGRAGLKVGLAWAGNPRRYDPVASAVDRRRSLDLALLAPLAAVAGVCFVSLQKELPSSDVPAYPPGLRVVDWTGELRDFADSAALVAALDLVITVDTAPAHLAGALGVPVWVLNRFDTCWRWLPGVGAEVPERSPWYPTMRLITQSQSGDWSVPIGQCEALLRKMVAKGD